MARGSQGMVLLDGLLRDLRYALRSLAKDRRFSLIAILALALGIGASTVVFSVVYNAIFEPVPYKDFQRSVVFKVQNLVNSGDWKGREYFFSSEILAFREQNHVFEEMIAYERRRDYYRDGKSGHYLPMGAVVTANTFNYLGVPPLRGRGVSQDDGKAGAPPRVRGELPTVADGIRRRSEHSRQGLHPGRSTDHACGHHALAL